MHVIVIVIVIVNVNVNVNVNRSASPSMQSQVNPPGLSHETPKAIKHMVQKLKHVYCCDPCQLVREPLCHG